MLLQYGEEVEKQSDNPGKVYRLKVVTSYTFSDKFASERTELCIFEDYIFGGKGSISMRYMFGGERGVALVLSRS